MAKRRSTGDHVCAGGVVWRREGRGPWTLAVVHRAAYGDASLPKGHVEKGETLLDAAIREVLEETGCRARPIELLTATTYPVGAAQKYVLWWSMAFDAQVAEPAEGEIAALTWLTPARARRALSYDSERAVLALAEAAARR